MQKIYDHARFWYKPRPSGVNDSVRPLWQEFLGCSNEETKSRTNFVATCTYSWFLTACTGIALGIGALAPFLAGWGGGGTLMLCVCTFVCNFILGAQWNVNFICHTLQKIMWCHTFLGDTGPIHVCPDTFSPRAWKGAGQKTSRDHDPFVGRGGPVGTRL